MSSRADDALARSAHELREELDGLQRAASDLRSDLSRLAEACAAAEAKAFAAVEAGDVAAARSHLADCQRNLDAGAAIEAELIVLDSLMTLCRDGLAALGVDEPSPS